MILGRSVHFDCGTSMSRFTVALLPKRFRCFGARPSRRVVRQPAHTLGFKRVVARERAALFTDLP